MIARVAMASTPQDRFVQRIRTIEARIDQLPEDAVQAALAELDRLRRQVLVELAGVQGFDAFRLRALLTRLEGVTERFGERYGLAIAPFQREAVDLGRQIVTEPLIQSGLTYGVPEIPRRLIEAQLDFQADLISGLTNDATRRVSQTIRLGAIQGQSVFEVMREVGTELDDSGPFASIAARAEAITRTELGRLQSITSDATLVESKRLVQDLLKQWWHSGATNFRPTHLAAHGQTREVDDYFDVAPAPGKPSERLRYPRDPSASAANTIQCGCLSVPFKADWPA